MNNKEKFMKFCKMLVMKEGKLSCKDVQQCGYSFEVFLRLPETKSGMEKLARKAEGILYENGYRTLGGKTLRHVESGR